MRNRRRFCPFSELFIKNYNTKIFLIDLPEANLMSVYYLENFFLKKIIIYLNILIKDFCSSQILIIMILLFHSNCKIDKNIKIDFFINTRFRVMEMNFNTIKSYFDLIQTHSIEGSFFLNINRYEKYCWTIY